MTKNMKASGAVLLLIFTLYACSQGENQVKKLKEPAKSSEEKDTQVEEILSMKELAVPDLIDLLNEEPESDSSKEKLQWSAKVTAMNILSELKAEEALPSLKHMLETSENLSAINNSARSIGRIGGVNAFIILKDVYAKIKRTAYSMNEEREKAVIISLGLCGDRNAVPLLADELYDGSNDTITRIYAAGSLALLGNNDGYALVNENLSSDVEEIRLAALRALGFFGTPASVPALKSAVKNDESTIHQRAAKLSLMQVEEKNLSMEKKTGFIQNQLIGNPGITEIQQWGTQRLKTMNTAESKNALVEISVLITPEHASLKRAARMRLITMD